MSIHVDLSPRLNNTPTQNQLRPRPIYHVTTNSTNTDYFDSMQASNELFFDNMDSRVDKLYDRFVGSHRFK